MTLVKERLAGCNAESLDSYLRGLGFFLLAGEVEPSVRAWWDEDGILWLASNLALAELVEQVTDRVHDKPPRLRTPWRGGSGRGRDFVELRNLAEEDELDWFDASILPLADGSRQNNPLLGEGASFGRGEIAEGYEIALSTLRKASRAWVERILRDLLLGSPTERGVAQALAIRRKILGAYQSGRAALPGSSANDVKPEGQKPRTLAWDVVLVFRGARLFRGVTAKRADPGARVQAAFPLVVQSRPFGIRAGGVADQWRDPPRTFELLAPLWSRPCTVRTLMHLIPATRIRLPRGDVARDALDAALIQSARATAGLGFDRLVRFALIPPNPKKPARYAARRGEIYALGRRAAHQAVEDIFPFLRDIERELARRDGKEPPSLEISRRRLENALAGLGYRAPSSGSLALSEARSAQEVLIALAALEAPAAWLASQPDHPLQPPRLSSEWFRHADDRAATFLLARSLVSGFSTGDVCLLRETLLPHRRNDDGRFVLDAARTPPDLERVSDPLGVLVALVLTAVRRTRPENLQRAGSTSFSALAGLLAGTLGSEGERRLALLAAALAGVHPAEPSASQAENPLAVGIGADVARLLLAAQPATASSRNGAREATESPNAALERTTTLASLLLAGRIDVARTIADSELRRRGLDLLPTPPRRAPTPPPAALALAVLLPFDGEACAALERIVTVTPANTLVTQEGGTP